MEGLLHNRVINIGLTKRKTFQQPKGYEGVSNVDTYRKEHSRQREAKFSKQEEAACSEQQRARKSSQLDSRKVVRKEE